LFEVVGLFQLFNKWKTNLDLNQQAASEDCCVQGLTCREHTSKRKAVLKNDEIDPHLAHV
jgi:hypothetical protein